MAYSMLDVEASCGPKATHHSQVTIELPYDGTLQQRLTTGVDLQVSVAGSLRPKHSLCEAHGGDVGKNKQHSATKDTSSIAKCRAALSRGWPLKGLYPIPEVGVEKDAESDTSTCASVDSDFPDEASVTKCSGRARLQRTRFSKIGSCTLAPP
eukprot:TRINITY_DN92251_c0_g1_i1.p1 TRINITY_DN92251_c0_g1~~TRINITY_DN92251_c0_g1_i1.p1  ORF type:complete len:179 (+),score=17.00 TRINITY_DN92251_c0_g1_i1:79-537(+)